MNKARSEIKLLSTRNLILLFVLLFFVLYGVCNTHIYYLELTPFGIGIVFSLILIGLNGYYLSIVYFLAYLLSGLTLISLYSAINVAVILSLLQYLLSREKIKLNKINIFIFAILSQIAFIVSSFGDGKQVLALFVSLILGLLFLYLCMIFFDATLNKCMMMKLSLDEKICGGIILIVFIVGMSASNVGIINLGLIFVSLIVLIATVVSSSAVTIIVSTLMGIGFAVSTGNTSYISMFIVLSLSTIAFRCQHRIFSVISIILTYIIYSLIFSYGVSLGEILSIGIGAIIFIAIPKKLIFSLGEIFNIKSQIIHKNIITRSKEKIVSRVKELSLVFDEMDMVYRDMVRGVLDDKNAIAMLKAELVKSVCDRCPNKDACYRQNSSFLENSIDNLLAIGYEKKKVLLIDLPEYLASNCIRVNNLLSVLNSMLTSYTEYTEVVSNIDASRLLIADQLRGVSRLLTSLAKEVNVNISYDIQFEKLIREELEYHNIICLECVSYEQDIQTKYINMIIKTSTINEKLIEKIVSKITKNKMCITSIQPSEVAGASIVNMMTRPNFDITFGSSVISKSGKIVCGDSHTIIKIDDGKFLVSLCDGMGNGESAHSISRLTISLIEKFYRAGFENDIILDSVNKLLSINEDENFSTIDLCVIDGRKNIYDFIKLGASNGYIKRDNGVVDVIEGSGLPVGMLEEIHPHIIKKLINSMDMIILVSDGVADSFEDGELQREILCLDTVNPQLLSQEILQLVVDRNNNIRPDDMTVVCVRVFESV